MDSVFTCEINPSSDWMRGRTPCLWIPSGVKPKHLNTMGNTIQCGWCHQVSWGKWQGGSFLLHTSKVYSLVLVLIPSAGRRFALVGEPFLVTKTQDWVGFTLGTLYLRDRRIMSLMPSLSKIKSSWVKNKLIKVWRDASADLRCGFLSYMAAHKQKLQNWWPPLTSLLIRHIHVAHTHM